MARTLRFVDSTPWYAFMIAIKGPGHIHISVFLPFTVILVSDFATAIKTVVPAATDASVV